MSTEQETLKRFFGASLAESDPEIFSAIGKELGRQQDQIELIASENIVSRPLDVDIVKLNGYGFPVWRGGPMQEADRIGLDKVLATVKDIYKVAGKGFEPSSALEWMVANKKTFADIKPGDLKGK